MRYFNTEGICKPDVHYMVRLDNRLREIRRLYIDRGKYFVINRGRQYGKTTTLMALADDLKDAYAVLPMDFQRISSSSFADEHVFSEKFIEYFERLFLQREHLKEYLCQDAVRALTEQKNKGSVSMDLLFAGLSRLCGTAKRPVVLMIDEVDSASCHEVFIEFLAQLRAYYLDRENSPLFHSVILAGVYDIKNLKRRIRPDKERRYNSPWNIAADFDMDMSFSAVQIQKMLEEYEADRHTGMQVAAVADEIEQYTSGYPYLVSAICKVMDEKLLDTLFATSSEDIWTREGIGEAVKMLLDKRLPLFDSMMRQISEYPDLKQMLYAMLFQGETFAYNPDHPVIELACMFGYMKNSNKTVQVANRMFEMRLYNLFLSEQELSSTMSRLAKREKNQFIKEGKLDMYRVLEKFTEYFEDIYGSKGDKFLEDSGRRLFLLYLKPIINGVGNYYIESQTRDARRTDVIVDYLGEQFVIEMKIWHGNEYHERGERQLAGYLDDYRLKKGYLLSFHFGKNKKPGIKKVRIGDKTIIEAVV
ncbi:MAG: ATP-binding protein [Eubacterium sp.]|nr:ATP-binding protein [Eubacterium sp.]